MAISRPHSRNQTILEVKSTSLFRRIASLGLPLLVLAVGCVTKRIVWSPDGKLAAVIGEKGLYLCDSEGKLSELLGPGIMLAEWFPDSRRLAVVRGFACKSWSEVQPVLDQATRGRIETAGKAAIKELDAGHDLNAALEAAGLPDGREKSLLGVYLKSVEGVVKKAGSNGPFLESIETKRFELCVAAVSDGKLTLGPPLASGLQEISDLRVAPGGTAIAYTCEPDDAAAQHEFDLKLVSVAESQPAKAIARRVSAFPDWTADGHSLVFIKAMGASGSDLLRLGSVARRRVLSDAGQIEVDEKIDELVGVLFDESGKVRCLKDGRILFSAIEAHLPTTAVDMPQRQQLFALDPDRQSTLTPLIPRSVQGSVPDNLSFFEVSPDMARVSLAGEKSAVAILTLATGAVELVQPAADSNAAGATPVWRNATELCYISVPKLESAFSASEVALWKKDRAYFLSETWPDEVRKGLLDK